MQTQRADSIAFYSYAHYSLTLAHTHTHARTFLWPRCPHVRYIISQSVAGISMRHARSPHAIDIHNILWFEKRKNTRVRWFQCHSLCFRCVHLWLCDACAKRIQINCLTKQCIIKISMGFGCNQLFRLTGQQMFQELQFIALHATSERQKFVENSVCFTTLFPLNVEQCAAVESRGRIAIFSSEWTEERRSVYEKWKMVKYSNSYAAHFGSIESDRLVLWLIHCFGHLSMHKSCIETIPSHSFIFRKE